MTPIREPRRRVILQVVLALAIGAGSLCLYLPHIGAVPFHPDESDWIFMSRDVDAVLSGDIRRLVWTRGTPLDNEIWLRLINAPVPKYMIGTARWAAGQGGQTNVRWNWEAGWDRNVEAGAVPSPTLLVAARSAAGAAAAGSVLLLFWIGCRISGRTTALLAAALLATHPLTLLHARRAMAESTAQLLSVLAVLVIMRFAWAVDRAPMGSYWRRWAVAAAVATGLAVAGKQSGVSLVALAILAAVLALRSAARPLPERVRFGVRTCIGLVVGSALTYFILSPAMYAQPVTSARTFVGARQALVRRQVAQTTLASPSSLTPSPVSRAKAAFREVYLAPPAFSEVSAYDDAIAPQVAEYRKSWLLAVWSSSLVRIAFALFSAIGVLASAREVVRDRAGQRTRNEQLLLGWLALQVAFVIAAIPMDWQRYFLPLLPPVSLLAGLGAVQAAKVLRALKG